MTDQTVTLAASWHAVVLKHARARARARTHTHTHTHMILRKEEVVGLGQTAEAHMRVDAVSNQEGKKLAKVSLTIRAMAKRGLMMMVLGPTPLKRAPAPSSETIRVTVGTQPL